MNSKGKKNQELEVELWRRMVTSLNKWGVRYCHWKSNEHLKAGLEGKTDLDILVRKEDSAAFIRVITRLDFKKVITQPKTTYVGVENWIGFCGKTGTLIHLHVHYCMVTGLKYVKEYTLPWHDYVLETAIIDPETGMRITDPNVELILLLLRLSIKSTFRALKKAKFMEGPPYSEYMQNELHYLHERATPEKVDEALDAMFPEPSKVEEQLRCLVQTKTPDAKDLLGLKRAVQTEFTSYCKYTPIQVMGKSFQGQTSLQWGRVLEKLGYDVMRRKRFESGGAVIAVIGGEEEKVRDLVGNMEKWLKWKMDVQTRELRQAEMVGTSDRSSDAYKAIHKQYKKLKTIHGLKLRGSLVLTQGYPCHLLQRHGGSSTALYTIKDSEDILFNRSDKKPLKLYRMMQDYTPDILIRLDKRPDEEHEGDNLIQESSYPFRMEEGAGKGRVYEVDVGKPLDELILEIRRIIWQNL